MLDLMRRHSEGWFIKVLFALIALSFIAFFGYNAADRSLGASTAALVGDQTIPLRQYEEAYDEALSRIQGQFEEGVPENFSRFLRSNVLRQMIQQKIKEEYAISLGFRVTDLELARMIRKQKQFYQGDTFDMFYYQKRFRPYYRHKYGIDFEKVLRDQLLIDLYDSFQRLGLILPPEELAWEDKVRGTTWKFDVISVDDTKAKDLFKDDEAADQKTQDMFSSWIELWRKDSIAKDKLEEVGANLSKDMEVNIKNLDKLFQGLMPEEYVRPILSLREPEEVFEHPIRLANTWYLIKLKERIVSEQKEDEKEDLKAPIEIVYNDFFTQWLDEFTKKLEIRTNIQL